MRRQNVLLTGWLVAPIFVVGLLCYWIIASLQAGPKMVAEPVGAGAGQTGGANAIGEIIAEHRGHAAVTLIVEDRTGGSADAGPLLIGLEGNGWAGVPMEADGAGRWVWHGHAGDLRHGFEFSRVDASGAVLHDPAGRRGLRISSGEQIERVEGLDR
jgi:hypothetical protein